MKPVHYYNTESPVSFISTSPLTQNLQLAHQIVDYVKDAVPFSHNNHLRGQIFTNHHTAASFALVADDISKRYNFFKNDTDLNDVQEDWEMLAEEIVKLRAGGCFELSIAGYAYGVQKLNLKNIEIIEMENGDHDFLVLGRNPFSKPNNYREWGDSCVVCDTWAESYYPASQIIPRLNGYIGTTLQNGRLIPVLEPFNPDSHSLNLLLSSIPNLENGSLHPMRISSFLS